MFIYPIYNHNWRNISTNYIYITRLASNEIFSPWNKIHRKVGRAKDLSAPRYLYLMYLLPATLASILIKLWPEGQCFDSMQGQEHLSSPWTAKKLWISHRVLPNKKKYGVFPQESDGEVKLHLNSPSLKVPYVLNLLLHVYLKRVIFLFTIIYSFLFQDPY